MSAFQDPKPAVLLSWLAWLVGAGVVAASDGHRWELADDSLALQRGGQILWQFNHGPRHPKPCFHPLALPDSPALTWFRPDDHRWHRGLWFSWKFINGVNYWEESRDTGASAGVTETLKTLVEPRDDFGARVEQELLYRPANGEPVLTEHRVIEVAPPGQGGSCVIDWTMQFTARTEVVLDRTPLPGETGGQVFGGYAGLSVRLTGGLDDVAVLTTDGPVSFKDDRFRGKSPGLDYQGMLGGRAVGVAVLDHPANLNAPSPWYAIDGPVMRFFSPAVLCYGPHRLSAGQTFTLRYRVIVHPERWDAARLSGEASRFAEGR